MPEAYDRTTRDGKPLNWRTREMLEIAERRAGVRSVVVKGSYTPEGSGGTHAGGGVIDLRTWHLTEAEKARLLRELREVGMFAWQRRPPEFDEHIHAGALGDRELSPTARWQAQWYRDGFNGLWHMVAGTPVPNGNDDGPSVAYTVYPQDLQEFDMTKDEHDALMRVDRLLSGWQNVPNRASDAPADEIGYQDRAMYNYARIARIDQNVAKVLLAPGVVSAADVDEQALAAAWLALIPTMDIQTILDAIALVPDATRAAIKDAL